MQGIIHMFKKIIPLAICLLAVSTTVSAEQPSARSVDQLMKLTEVNNMVDSLYGRVGQMFQGYAQQLQVTEAERPIVDKYFKQSIELMKKNVTWDQLQAPMRDVYTNHFTESEVNELIRFYSSDVGKSLVQKLPNVMNESMGITQMAMQNVMPQIQSVTNDMVQELKDKRGE